MIIYKVYEDGKLCSDYNIKGWDCSTFPTPKEAKMFLVRWVYPAHLTDEQVIDFILDNDIHVGKVFDWYGSQMLIKKEYL